MAFENLTKVLSFPAAGDLSGFQFYAVKISSGQITTISATTDKPIGVLQDTPDAAGVMGAVCIEGVSKLITYNGTLAINDSLGVGTDGVAAVTTTDNRWVVADLMDLDGSGTDAGLNVAVSVNVNVHRY